MSYASGDLPCGPTPAYTSAANASDWIGIEILDEADHDWALGLIELAVAANLPTATPGLPPEGTELARRRRFH